MLMSYRSGAHTVSHLVKHRPSLAAARRACGLGHSVVSLCVHGGFRTSSPSPAANHRWRSKASGLPDCWLTAGSGWRHVRCLFVLLVNVVGLQVTHFWAMYRTNSDRMWRSRAAWARCSPIRGQRVTLVQLLSILTLQQILSIADTHDNQCLMKSLNDSKTTLFCLF